MCRRTYQRVHKRHSTVQQIKKSEGRPRRSVDATRSRRPAPARIATLFLRGPGQFLKTKWRITPRSRRGRGPATLAGPLLTALSKGNDPRPRMGNHRRLGRPASVSARSRGVTPAGAGIAHHRAERQRPAGGAAPPAPRPSQPLLARGAWASQGERPSSPANKAAHQLTEVPSPG